MRILDVTTAAGTPVRVVHVAAGETGYMATVPYGDHDVVEFYDLRHSGVRAGTGVPGSWSARQSAATACRADDIRGASGGLVLDTCEPAPHVDPAAMGLVREWLAAAVPLTGIQHEHTLVAGVAGNLMTTDIADVRPGDIIFRGGHLVRRVLRAPARTRQLGPDGDYLFEYPVAHLYLPDDVTGAGTNVFLTPEGTSVLILRPAPGPGPGTP